MPDNFHIVETDWATDSRALHTVRQQVFIEELGVDSETEWDHRDETAWHWLARLDNGDLAGCIRMQRDGHIGRTAVLAKYRNQGIATALLGAAIAKARSEQLYEVFLYARDNACSLYRRAGFIPSGAEFTLQQQPRITMRQVLCEQHLLGLHAGRFAVTQLHDEALNLISQCRRQLLILNHDLDPEHFDHEDICSAVSKLARRARLAEIKILIVDSSALIKRGHRLLELQRRLSSKIALRKLPDRIEPPARCWLIGDLRGVICQDLQATAQTWADYHCRPVAETMATQFNDLWHKSQEDPQLKVLHL